MKWTETLIPTLRQLPSDVEAESHKLMLKAGLIRQLSSGTYSYLPLGLKALRKVESIIREEMDAVGGLEVLLPALQPSDLWKESGRYDDLGEDMVSFIDRHKSEHILGPTHEEVITDLIRREVKSYRQLPLLIYQIQTKFRDEMRPRFGVIRSKEFIMKDAYSFHTDWDDLDKRYQRMYDAYCKIFQRCGLKYIAVEADPGIMGGNVSHEFMVLSERGEDTVVACKACGYAASLDMAECLKPEICQRGVFPARESSAGATVNDLHGGNLTERKCDELKPLTELDTPNAKTIEQVSSQLKVKPRKMVKTIIYKTEQGVVAALVRGDHEVNSVKLAKVLKVKELELADEKTICSLTSAPVGFAGPVGLKDVKIVCDHQVGLLSNFVTGANKKDKHIVNVNIQRDFKPDQMADIRYITDGEQCPKCPAKIKRSQAIEIGHIFKLGTKYSKALGAGFLDNKGEENLIIMGCYGIGVNRIIASLIESSYDKDGIIWPRALSPYQVLLLPLEPSGPIAEYAQALYTQLKEAGLEVLLDDRDERPGIKFKDADLIGIPLRVTIGARNLNEGKVEIVTRSDKETVLVKKDQVLEKLKELI